MKNIFTAIAALFLCMQVPVLAQGFVNLDFSGLSNYTVNNRPIGTTGVTYSMERVVDVNSGTPSTIGYTDGTLVFEGLCTNCGPTIRITFSQPVELLISGKTNDGSWFGNDGLFTVSTLTGGLVLSDPNNELTGITTSPSQVTFNGITACNGSGATPCSNWSLTSQYISSLDINFTADQNNGTAIRFRINSALPVNVPTLSQWGFILLGLVILCIGGVFVWRRSRLLRMA